MRSEHQALIEVAKERAGDALRAAAAYRDDEIRVLYVRDDLETISFRERAEHVAEGIQSRQPLLRHPSAGDCLADLELYENYVLVHWYDERIILSFEATIARQLSGFIEECNLALESPTASRFHHDEQ